MRDAILSRFLTCALALLGGVQLDALSPRVLPDGYTRRVWQMQDGLPENTVQAFAQTPDHYLWIGTSGGLVRFDGARFIVFDRENTTAIHENSIFCLSVSRDGSLWIGTDGGGLVRYREGVFRAYSEANGLSNSFVRAVNEDHEGKLWVGTDNGLFQLVDDHLVRVDGIGKLPAVAVHDIREDRSGRLWVGGSALITIRGTEGKEFLLKDHPSANRIKSILETRDGTLWVGTVSGLQRLRRTSLESGRFERVKEVTSTVRSLCEDRAGVLWIGTIGQGLIRFRDGRFTQVTALDAPPSSTVLALFEDNEHNVWAGMQTSLLRLSRTAMSTFPLPDAANADFGTVYPDRTGNLWVASAHLYRIDSRRSASELIALPGSGIRVRNVFRDHEGTLWMGTEGHGVFRLKDNRQIRYTTRTGLVNDFVRAFLETRDGSIWIGTDEGITRWHEGRLTNYLMADGLCYFSIRALLEDGHGDLWIGTERGVSHWRNGSFLQDEVTRSLRSEKVWAIHEDRDGGLWFGTRGGGLFRWRAGKLASFRNTEGLASNSIYQILEDARGTFWMSGPNGISSVSRADLDRFVDHPEYHPGVTLYGLSDGVEATQIHGGVQPAGCLTASGEVWFPSNRGPIRILPDQTRAVDLPQMVIEQVLVDGRDAVTSGHLVVPPGEGRLQIDYSAIRLRSQEGIRFRYKLEGFDHEWTEALRSHIANYTNLPPGQYRFRVQAFEMNMPESVTEAALAIEWRPHLYRMGWFLFLLAMLVAASILIAILVAYRLRLRRVHARFDAVLEERNRVAREMHDTVIQGCTSTSALLEAVVSLKQEEFEPRRELLDCARNQVRATVDEARRAVWNLRQTGSTLAEIGSQLHQMAQQISHDARLPVLFETSGIPSILDPAVEHDVLMVAREAVYNAVRHGQPHQVRVAIHFEPGKLRMEVIDDGCGFQVEQPFSMPGVHFGLIGMRERIERLGGRFDVKSSPGRGTHLVVDVPLQPAAAGRPRR